jgi:hypothetical protein
MMSCHSTTALILAYMLFCCEVAHADAKKSADFCRNSSGVNMVDTASIVSNGFVTRMKVVGVNTVARYYDYPNETLPGKRLRKDEFKLLVTHKMKLLAVFQHHNNKASTFINWNRRGPSDAAEALKLSKTFSQPPKSAIYFGVDGDFVGTTTHRYKYYSAEVKGYFSEIKRIFRASPTRYEIGVYGSGEACKMLVGAGLVKYCWLSHSHGFVGSKDALRNGKYHVEQYLPGMCGGRSIDFNKFKANITDVGQFTPTP